MKQWSTSCTDWRERILKGESLISFPPLFPDEAEEGLSVLNDLKLVDVIGRPTFGEVARPWLIDFVKAIFGAYDNTEGSPTRGQQFIREFFFLVSKKNSKSSTAAAVMLTALIRNWRDSAEFLILAPTVEVANASFFPARDMVRADEELSDMFNVQEHYRQITNRNNGALLKIVAADSDTVGGKKATGVLVDELWLLGKRPNAENMLREATGGLASRPEGFVIYLSTQSDEAPAGIFKQKLDYARGVRDGRIDDNQFLPVIYEFPEKIIEEKLHLNPKYFFVTNPNLGASVDEKFLLREFKKAEESGPQSMQGFLAKHLNVEMGVSLKHQNWPGSEFWEGSAGIVTLETLLERSEVIVAGIDGGGLDDMLGLALIGREIETHNWLLWTHAWLHAIALQRRKENAPRYRDFEKDGDLTIVDDIAHQRKQLADIIIRVEESGLLDKIGVDPLGLGLIADEIEGRLDSSGRQIIEHDRIVGVPQGYRMSGATKTLEVMAAGKTLIHGGQPLMSWCVGNAKVEQKGNAISITKAVSGQCKIDPLVAAICATALMAMNPEAKIVSAYTGLSYEQILERMSI